MSLPPADHRAQLVAAVFGTHRPAALDIEATLRKYMWRLYSMEPSQLEEVHGKWLCFPGAQEMCSAEEVRTRGFYGFATEAMPALMVYYAAVHHGWRPLGLAGPQTATGTQPVYVGPPMPMHGVKGSALCLTPTDHVLKQAGFNPNAK
jgi:hypothetical protein